ncbi:MAG: response regulator transcription factor [Chloroflexota bacterium]
MVLSRVAEQAREQAPRVLLVDDDEALLAALDLALTRRGFRVVTAREAGEAFGRLEDSGEVDLIVLDVMMPGMDGVTLCRLLRDRTSTPLLMLTARDAVADRIAGLEAGADDYLQKPFDLDELVARLLALRRRARQSQGPEQAERAYQDLTLDSRTWSVKRGKRNLGLTPTEFRILELLLQSPETVRKREDLMRTIWGENWVEADSGTLEVHIANLRQKLERGGEARLIHTIRGVGYVLKA